jgi:riboflavin kinase/FMN adenylyltransferase
MEVVTNLNALGPKLERVVLTIGNFDGVHLGHRQIIELAVQQARAAHGNSLVFTFSPHPRVALQVDPSFQLLTTYTERNERIGALGVDFLVEQPFTREFSNLSAEGFFAELLKTVPLRAVIVGHDFGFGNQRGGQLETLERLCQRSGIALTVVPPFKQGDLAVSSSRIRKCLSVGDVRSARTLLGYPFTLRGVVMRGDGRGRTIGIPTANLEAEEKLSLPLGVYVTRASVLEKSTVSVTNIGRRPTFDEATAGVKIETHILDETLELYGVRMELEFLDHLREELRFNSKDELVRQIRQDIDEARRRFATLA